MYLNLFKLSIFKNGLNSSEPSPVTVTRLGAKVNYNLYMVHS